MDHIVLELGRYNVSVGALRETKWFEDGSMRWMVVCC